MDPIPTAAPGRSIPVPGTAGPAPASAARPGSRRRSAGVTAALLAVLLASGCGSAAGTADPPAAPSTGPATAAGAGFNGTDIAWVQLMIPMYEGLLPMLDLPAAQHADPGVVRLSAQVRDARRSELARLRVLRDLAGLPATNMHEGHDMPGMVSAEELSFISHSEGAQFLDVFIESMREHLDQCAQLAESEQKAGASQDVKALAGLVERSSRAGREQLSRLERR